jgi:hypothetical protein
VIEATQSEAKDGWRRRSNNCGQQSGCSALRLRMQEREQVILPSRDGEFPDEGKDLNER